ncbi:hypothetical protein U1Q18_023474 [Sarracenia purpurea var. burkii]
MSGFNAYEHLNVVLNADGSLTRLLKIPTIPATGDVEIPDDQPVLSKDVDLDPKLKTWLRIYLATEQTSGAKLPIVFYFHGGGWIDFSAASAMTHDHCNKLALDIPAIIISVEYRLAPEHRLPAQYEDAVQSMLWVKKQALDPNGDKWLREYGDFSRVQQWRKHRLPRRFTSPGSRPRAHEDRRASNEPTDDQRKTTDQVGVEVRHRPGLAVAGHRSLLGAGVTAGNEQGPPVFQSDGRRPSQREDQIAGAVLGDRIRRRSDGRQATGIRENVGAEWSSGGSAVRRYRVPRDRLDRFSTRRRGFEYH